MNPATNVAASNARPYLTIVKALGLDAVYIASSAAPKREKNKVGLPLTNAANDGSIPESGRNNTLMSLAGTMRQKGMSEAAIVAALQAENAARCKPPLDPSEVSAIAKSVMRYAAADPDSLLKSLTDTGNAARFSMRYRDQVRHVFGMGWIIWDGMRWCRDQVGQIMEMAKALAMTINQEAIGIKDDDIAEAISKHAKASLQAPKLKAMLDLSCSEPALVTKVSDLDSHDMLLGVGNGVVNLKTGKLQSSKREDLLTLHSPVVFDPKATCPQFIAFIDQVTGGDQQLAGYLQRVVGYGLTGSTNEQCLFFLYGIGANGKSTFLNVVKALLGEDLAKQTPTETLMVKRTAATNDLARLQNVRIVIANEVEEGSLLAESLVKNMTGGEAMAAKFHYHEYFEFTPKFKLFIAGNHKPTVRGRDDGIWRRIRMIPFEVTIPLSQRDKHLQEKLLAELPGILNWAIKGCMDWQKRQLSEPKVVTSAVSSYRQDMDIFRQWLTDRGKAGPLEECKASVAYQSYRQWALDNGYHVMASGNFGRDLADRFKRVARKDGNYYLGISVIL